MIKASHLQFSIITSSFVYPRYANFLHLPMEGPQMPFTNTNNFCILLSVICAQHTKVFFLPQFSIGRILLMCLMLLISPHTFSICWQVQICSSLEFIVKSLISSNNAAVAIVRNKRQTFKFENLILQ